MKLMLLVLTALVLSVVPALAQDKPLRPISWNGITLWIEPDFATGIDFTEVKGGPADDRSELADAPHGQITLYNPPARRGDFAQMVAYIHIYQVEEMAAYPTATAQVDALYALLHNVSSIDEDVELRTAQQAGTLPYLPIRPQPNVLMAQAHYVGARGLSGIAYITAKSDHHDPLSNRSLTYTFQGLSLDRLTYVAVSVPLTTTLFPSEVEVDPSRLEVRWSEYLQQSTQTVQSARSRSFQPVPGAIDEMLKRMSVAVG